MGGAGVAQAKSPPEEGCRRETRLSSTGHSEHRHCLEAALPDFLSVLPPLPFAHKGAFGFLIFLYASLFFPTFALIGLSLSRSHAFRLTPFERNTGGILKCGGRLR